MMLSSILPVPMFGLFFSILATACPSDETHHHQSESAINKRDLRSDETVARCGTPDFVLSKTDEKILKKKFAAIEKKNLNKVASDTITIEVVFQVITSGSFGTDVSDATLDEQIDVMNTAFAPHNIGFTLKSTSRIDDSNLYNDCSGGEDSFKAQIRDPNDGPEILYFYICDLSDGLLGYATFPSWYNDDPLLDGVVCTASSLPGGSGAPYNLGQTATHEVGHWMGLLHTFQGGCDGGDFIDDTPPQAVETFGCPTDPDTCPAAGFDPKENFMNYSDDICMERFTADQAVRMRSMWDIYRSPTSSSASSPIEVTPNVPLTGQELSTAGAWQTYIVQNVPIASFISVELSGTNGDADLFVGFCSSISANSSMETCTTAIPTDTDDGAFVFEVFASEAFSDLSISVTFVSAFTFQEVDFEDFTITGIDLATEEFLVYVMSDIPAGETVEVSTSADNGDADLFLSTSEQGLVCFSESVSSNEECSFEADTATNLTIEVYAYEAVTDLTLVVDVGSSAPTPNPPTEEFKSCNFFIAILAFLLKIITFGFINLCG